MKRHEAKKIITQQRTEGRSRNAERGGVRYLLPVTCYLLLALLFASCSSRPKASFPADEEGAEFSLLPLGAQVYLWADTVTGRPLLDVLSFDGMSLSDAAIILDNTDTAVAAIFPNENTERRFYLAGFGKYPSSRAGFFFTFSRDWKRLNASGGRNYWYSQNGELAVSVGSNLALVSNTDPYTGTFAVIPPSGFLEFRKGLGLAGWISNPREPVNDFLDSIGLPIMIPAEDFFFGAARLPAGSDPGLHPWELAIMIRTSSAVEARSLLSLVTLTRRYLPPNDSSVSSLTPQQAVAILFANTPEINGNQVTIRTDSMDENRIALLFNMFSIYSN